mmetsp:Transcript_89412/g.255326  ORF Transcript_89412/g.255326 Transcript_89412/m.255326 type:complete len:182 (+) Transcript_89412:338-883(+)
MHGDNACQVDRYQMCALQAVPSSEAWEMIHCNFQYQSCLKVDEATDTSHPNCYKDYIQQFCTESFATSTTHEELSTCQASDESEQWMMDSATATTEATGNVVSLKHSQRRQPHSHPALRTLCLTPSTHHPLPTYDQPPPPLDTCPPLPPRPRRSLRSWAASVGPHRRRGGLRLLVGHRLVG